MGFPKYMFFGAASFLLLWALSVAGALAVLPSWTVAKPEHGEGVVTPGGKRLNRSRALLTAGCGVIWICTLMGHALTGSNETAFGFWERHPPALQILVFIAGILWIISSFFSWNARGSKPWILQVGTSAMAIAGIFAFFILLA